MPAKTKSAKPAPVKVRSKSELVAYLADRHSLSRPAVKALLEDLAATAASDLKRKGVAKFVLPDLVTLKVVRKAARKERQGTNPFNGEAMTFAAKPARNAVRASFPKSLRDSI